VGMTNSLSLRQYENARDSIFRKQDPDSKLTVRNCRLEPALISNDGFAFPSQKHICLLARMRSFE
jgi:hypothetical protein